MGLQFDESVVYQHTYLKITVCVLAARASRVDGESRPPTPATIRSNFVVMIVFPNSVKSGSSRQPLWENYFESMTHPAVVDKGAALSVLRIAALLTTSCTGKETK